MSSHFLIDAFLAATPPGEIERRQEFVHATYEKYDFAPDTAAVIGGGAFALAGMDARIVSSGEMHGFDLDVLVTQARMRRLYEESGFDLPRSYIYTTLFSNKGDPHVDAFSNIKGQKGWLVEFSDVLEQSVIIRGCRTVMPVMAAEMRLQMPMRRGKAALGIVKAHASAYGQEMKIVDNPEWQQQVAAACRRAQYRPPSEHMEWFDELTALPAGVASHPAFSFMKDSGKLRSASRRYLFVVGLAG